MILVKNDKVAELLTQGKHYNITVIVSSQNAVHFLDQLKDQRNIVFLFPERVENTYIRTLWNNV